MKRMKRMVRKGIILTVGGCLIAMLIAGCEEQNLSTARMDKLVAYENKQLKEQVAQQKEKIEEQNRLLGECQQKKKALEEKLEEELNNGIGDVMDLFGEATKQLEQENGQLKAQIEELQGKVRKLEQELEKLKPPAGPQPLTP